MDSSVSIGNLVEKLCHKLPDIRDRSMRALSRKILSPLATSEHFEIMSQISGSSHAILQWINDRYDTSDPALVSQALELCHALSSRSESMRVSLLEAGAVSFFEDFTVSTALYSFIKNKGISISRKGKSFQGRSQSNKSKSIHDKRKIRSI